MLRLSLAMLTILVASAWSQTQKPSLPDPVKFVYKYDIVFNVVRSVFTDMGYNIELEDRKGGRLACRPYEFISGSLTSSEVEKMAVKRDTVTGDWIRARYVPEALIEIITPTETMVTIRTRFEALSRDIDGTEKWVPLDSLGTIERRILGRISMRLLGNELQYDNKKGFWDKEPASPDPRRPKPYPTRPPL